MKSIEELYQKLEDPSSKVISKSYVKDMVEKIVQEARETKKVAL
jgi:DNA-binding transcriptional regulator WhiA